MLIAMSILVAGVGNLRPEVKDLTGLPPDPRRDQIGGHPLGITTASIHARERAKWAASEIRLRFRIPRPATHSGQCVGPRPGPILLMPPRYAGRDVVAQEPSRHPARGKAGAPDPSGSDPGGRLPAWRNGSPQ